MKILKMLAPVWEHTRYSRSMVMLILNFRKFSFGAKAYFIVKLLWQSWFSCFFFMMAMTTLKMLAPVREHTRYSRSMAMLILNLRNFLSEPYLWEIFYVLIHVTSDDGSMLDDSKDSDAALWARIRHSCFVKMILQLFISEPYETFTQSNLIVLLISSPLYTSSLQMPTRN